MTERAAFFIEVEQIVERVVEYAATDRRVFTVSRTVEPTAADLSSLTITVNKAEALAAQLAFYSPAALEYVASLLRARDGVISRRVATSIGPSRGNGLVGAVFLLFGLITFLSAIKAWFPAVSSWLLLISLVALMWLGWFIVSGIISAGHGTSRLLWYADIISAVVAAKKNGALNAQQAVAEQPQPEVVR